MSEMVERVKAALRLSIENSGHNFRDAGAEAVFRDAAKAAIAEMREPTEAMCCAGNWLCGDERGNPGIEAEGIWQAMIDKAVE